MSDLERNSVEVAAKATGLRPDQIERAVKEYREAVEKIMDGEPEWRAIMHMSGPKYGSHTYGAEGTDIILTVENWKERGEWKSERRYQYKGKLYEHFGEAKAVELKETARPKPYGLDGSP